MPQLHFPVGRAGLTVPVWVGLSGREIVMLLAAGQYVPPPQPARGLLDTGTDVTAFAGGILQALGVAPTTTATTTTASGQVRVRLFEVSLSITDPTHSPPAWLTVPHLLVMELPGNLPDVEVLIGLDVLLQYRMSLDGPGRHFSLGD